MAKDLKDIEEGSALAAAVFHLASAKAAHDHRVAGRNTTLTAKLSRLVDVLEFKLEEKADDILKSDDAKSTLEALDKAKLDLNRKRDAELARNPSPNAPYHKPRTGQVAAKGPAGPSTEQK